MLARRQWVAWQRLLLWVSIGALGMIVLAVAGNWYQRSRSAWERDWLAGIPCRPPCWEGITPGQTMASEAERILRQHFQVGKLNHFQFDTIPYCIVYWERWKNGYGGGNVTYHRDTSIVSLIGLSFPHDFTLAEVMQAYGQPSHVLALAERNFERLNEINYSLVVVYEPQGFLLLWHWMYPQRPVIDQRLSFRTVAFFEPTVEGLEYALGNPVHAELLVPWKGLVDFQEYCHPMGSTGPDPCKAEEQ